MEEETEVPMPEASDETEGVSGNVSNQLATLVPTFDPSKDDLNVYQQKVALILEAWPPGKHTELATRLILNCTGSAFKKLQLHQSELVVNDRKSIQRIVELLGGHWGQIDLEKRYEFAERALYKCVQKGDESADSYLARADIMWTELNSKKFQLSDLQAYVTLRGSMLSAEDKKRVLVDADVADKGELTVKRVGAAIRMLGASFFQEMTAGKRATKLKTYDQSTLVAEDIDDTENDQYAMAAESMEDEDQAVETLAQEGDDDATLVMDFEAAATEVLQNDEELASAFTAYTDARRRLNEKVRSRGFWPINHKGKSKGSWKGPKGKFSKGHASSRKSLQQRILESRCRLCNQVGHWKAECPNRRDSSGASNRPAQVPTTMAQVVSCGNGSDDVLPMEFVNLPMLQEPTLDVPQHDESIVLTMVSQPEHASSVFDAKVQLKQTLHRWQGGNQNRVKPFRTDDGNDRDVRRRLKNRLAACSAEPNFKETDLPSVDVACFASHGSLGIVDLGATKTVIGSKLVPELLNGLDPTIRKSVSRCPCNVTFRFGNHGILQSQQAIVVPIHGLLLKIAVVPGATPFLLSNTLLRALGATIDTTNHMLHATKISKSFPLNLTSKGLFLLDLNDLAQPALGSTNFSKLAETHATASDNADIRAEQQKTESAATDTSTDMSSESQISTSKKLTANCYNNLINLNNQSHEECTTVESEVSKAEEPSWTACPAVPVQSSTIQSKPNCQSSLRSKSIPRSFQVLSRQCHVEPCPASAKGSAARDRSRVRFQSSVDGTAGDEQDQIWQDSRGKDISPHVDTRAEVGPLVHSTLCPESQVRAPHVPLLRGEKDRKVRAHWNEGVAQQCDRGDQGCSIEQSPWSPAQGQASDGADRKDAGGKHSGYSVGLRRGSGTLRDASRSRADLDGQCRGPDGTPNGQRGECLVSHHHLHRAEHQQPGLRTVMPPECPSVAMQRDAGDVSADCFVSPEISFTCESNKERIRFNQLVNQYTHELQSMSQKQPHNNQPRLDLLEVFCGPQSQLTHQSQRLGYRAERMSLLQGDLQTRSGRETLFSKLVHQRPKNVWFSPSCGPWSGFSCLNGSRSIDAWDELQQTRMKFLEQVALGVVILRHQRQHGRHMHWEQPRGSLMFKLPYMQEVRYYMLAVDVDLCSAGDLKDPTNGLPIKKTLTILSTSSNLINGLTGLRCPGHSLHPQHQVIEGQIYVGGQRMNRSAFTENYPRKFARKVAVLLGKVQKPSEEPYRNEIWPVLAAEEHPEASPPKRLRTNRYASAKISRTCSIAQLPWGKRLKCTSKTTPIDAHAKWQEIFGKVNSQLPRVGKRCIDDPEVIAVIQQLVPDKTIVAVMACRGSSRTLAPPDHILKGMAPIRRSIFTERGSGEIRVEEEWEAWEELAKRNLIRPSHATRINMTMFARDQPFPGHQSHGLQMPSMPVPAPDVPDVQTPDNSEMPTPTEGTEVLPPAQEPKVTESWPSQELTSSQVADVRNASQSARFLALPKDEQVALLRAHKNLGHPSPERQHFVESTGIPSRDCTSGPRTQVLHVSREPTTQTGQTGQHQR